MAPGTVKAKVRVLAEATRVFGIHDVDPEIAPDSENGLVHFPDLDPTSESTILTRMVAQIQARRVLSVSHVAKSRVSIPR